MESVSFFVPNSSQLDGPIGFKGVIRKCLSLPWEKNLLEKLKNKKLHFVGSPVRSYDLCQTSCFSFRVVLEIGIRELQFPLFEVCRSSPRHVYLIKIPTTTKNSTFETFSQPVIMREGKRVRNVSPGKACNGLTATHVAPGRYTQTASSSRGGLSGCIGPCNCLTLWKTFPTVSLYNELNKVHKVLYYSCWFEINFSQKNIRDWDHCIVKLEVFGWK